MNERIEKLEKEIEEEQRNVAYDTREYTIEYIVDKYSNGKSGSEFFVPDYQREFVWDDYRQSRFIESLLIGLPIPYIFLAEIQSGRYEIVDGSQRIQTLNAFLNNKLKISKLEVLKSLNGFMFRNLPISRQRKFKNISLKMIFLSSHTKDKTKVEIFERINRGSDLLNDMEKRIGIYRGPFNDFICETAKNKLYSDLTPIAFWFKHRKEKEELLLRYFAFLEWYPNFKRKTGIAKQLDEYMDKKNNDFKVDKNMKDSMEKNLYKMINFVNISLPNGFSKNKESHRVSRVYFEAISVGITLALHENPNIDPKNCDLESIVKSENFKKIIFGKYYTHIPNRIAQRIDYIKNSLLGK